MTTEFLLWVSSLEQHLEIAGYFLFMQSCTELPSCELDECSDLLVIHLLSTWDQTQAVSAIISV